jgi:deoxyribodipyrimidine photolyase-related protein
MPAAFQGVGSPGWYDYPPQNQDTGLSPPYEFCRQKNISIWFIRYHRGENEQSITSVVDTHRQSSKLNTAFILFPNTLFYNTAPLWGCTHVFLIEEFLFFKLYRFHKQKLLFHRASMKAYEHYLQSKGLTLNYIDATQELSDIRAIIPHLATKGISTIKMYRPCDQWLEKRITIGCTETGINLELLDNPPFINTEQDLTDYLDKKTKYFHSDFYIYQRKTRKILVDKDLNPSYGKWSFDTDNRHKYPNGRKPPLSREKYISAFHAEASEYVSKYFSSNYGEIDTNYFYPIDHQQAKRAIIDFLSNRFPDFGSYEDAIVKDEVHLHHSVLSPLLNTGLVLPLDLVNAAIKYAAANNISYNSLEGFVRQILGWREFVRMIYTREGNKQRTKNYWQFTRKIPASFYEGTTGIKPVDATIKKLARSAYNHHIERLMIISNFMLLCEFHPDEVYRWFMEMYIDAYDWVMVPNVYGMGQFADGGIMCTEPYISGSNYIFKMSDYPKGEAWSEIWDALFWRFMHAHRSFFLQNPRLNMLIKTYDKWDESKQEEILMRADLFLGKLDK